MVDKPNMNLELEQGLKYISAVIIIVLASISGYFTYTEELNQAILYLAGTILALQIYASYTILQNMRKIHSKINYIGKQVDTEKIGETGKQKKEIPKQKRIQKVLENAEDMTTEKLEEAMEETNVKVEDLKLEDLRKKFNPPKKTDKE